MSKVLTFSRVFPSYHPRKGEPTYFVEKVVKSLHWDRPYPPVDIRADFDSDVYINARAKHHTIRAGHRWKAGDMFSPRVWSGKPYASKQIQFAPDIEVKKVWSFYKDEYKWCMLEQFNLESIAFNDGLSVVDFLDWFTLAPGKTFDGQIICWNENINY